MKMGSSRRGVVLTTIMMSLLPPVHSFDVYTGPIVFSLPHCKQLEPKGQLAPQKSEIKWRWFLWKGKIRGKICQSCQYFKWRNWGQKFQITVFLLSLSSRRGMGDSCLLALGYLFVVDGKRRRRQQLLTMGSPLKTKAERKWSQVGMPIVQTSTLLIYHWPQLRFMKQGYFDTILLTILLRFF